MLVPTLKPFSHAIAGNNSVIDAFRVVSPIPPDLGLIRIITLVSNPSSMCMGSTDCPLFFSYFCFNTCLLEVTNYFVTVCKSIVRTCNEYSRLLLEDFFSTDKSPNTPSGKSETFTSSDKNVENFNIVSPYK